MEKQLYSRNEVIGIIAKVKREAAKMEMYHVIKLKNMDEEETRKYYSDDDPTISCFTRAILTIDIEQFL